MTNSTARSEALAPSSPPTTSGVEAWLASAHPSPATPYGEWDGEARLALIPLGRRFDAVRIPAAVAHHAFASHDLPVVARRMARHLCGGPVIHDPAGSRYYALVPPGTAPHWRAPAAQCLGEGTYLGVPRPDLTEPDQGTLCSYWTVPVPRPGKLCQVPDVLTLAMAGGALADQDEGEATP
ncbi:hypothetical protein STRCI_008666 [Streptomyces cinnabarinus]|uniref:DNA primase/polymerase bifunctional N-terminal domain-containing protein n=1 Tax=Streptomyces cinnabarinus TaxID=67287 RepID=A0ABY7K7Y6_9ACTN|nr:hypothetical protein [Streptomyces cinnabarinus]WAZ18996.1 hypothetical protein STRCI_000009 [Streptomyces cinnabarinus]WAZ26972.1 hypothetical protein STRCI_008666 [Streptomyces cinnabarinus]